jgi:hypothetical protein
MATFKPDKPIITKEPFVTVDNTFKPGTYRFRLIVIREDGVESQPVFQDVTILPEGTRVPRPRPVIQPAEPVERVEAPTKPKKPKKPKDTTATKASSETKPTRKRARRGQGKRNNPNPEPK